MFQFKNKTTNQTLLLNEVDAIVAKFWGKEIDKKYYATPTDGGCNWFDILGKSIEDCQYFKHKSIEKNNLVFDMDTIASMILFHMTQYESNAEGKRKSVDYAMPYINLCYHLKSLHIVGVGLGW